MPAEKMKRGNKGAASNQAAPGKSAAELVDELEKAGEVLADEVQQTFQLLDQEVAGVAKFAMDQASSVTGRISTSQITHFHELMEVMKDTGEDSLKAVGEHFNLLLQQVAEMIEVGGSKTSKKKASKKKRAKKKATKKKTGKKKARKKRTSKKKATKKKAGKKKASKKRTSKKTTKKRAAKKKASKKKA